MTGVGIAKSSFIASSFFTPAGFWGALGIGSAVTPVGWAVAAGVIGAGLSLVIGKKIVRGSSDRVKVIPEFINTPLDVLATGLFDMMCILGIKVAAVDGKITNDEYLFIQSYFINEWGYDRRFVELGIREIEKGAADHTIKEITEKLALFKKENPDCNHESMAKELLIFINGIVEADGVIDEREEMALERIKKIFEDVNSLSYSFSEAAKNTANFVSESGKKSFDAASAGAKTAADTFTSIGADAKRHLDKFFTKKTE